MKFKEQDRMFVAKDSHMRDKNKTNYPFTNIVSKTLLLTLTIFECRINFSLKANSQQHSKINIILELQSDNKKRKMFLIIILCQYLRVDKNLLFLMPIISILL